MPPPKPAAGSADLTISFNCSRDPKPDIVTKTGKISSDCNRIDMDDGAFYTRVASSSPEPDSTTSVAIPPDGCMDAPLVHQVVAQASWEPVANGVRSGWQELHVGYTLANPNATSGGPVVNVDVVIQVCIISDDCRHNT